MHNIVFHLVILHTVIQVFRHIHSATHTYYCQARLLTAERRPGSITTLRCHQTYSVWPAPDQLMALLFPNLTWWYFQWLFAVFGCVTMGGLTNMKAVGLCSFPMTCSPQSFDALSRSQSWEEITLLCGAVWVSEFPIRILPSIVRFRVDSRNKTKCCALEAWT